MEWKIDKTLGYVYKLDKLSPYANKSQGKVYQHHEVMCLHIGRPLAPNECVHHIDRNRANNDISNLMLLTNSEHAKLHAIEDAQERTERYKLKALELIKECSEHEYTCKTCGTLFLAYARDAREFCSNACSAKNRRKFDPSKEELTALVWEMPSTEVAKLYGVSDAAVYKRCKLLGISKPPRGYWAKVHAGLIEKIDINNTEEQNNDNFTY